MGSGTVVCSVSEAMGVIASEFQGDRELRIGMQGQQGSTQVPSTHHPLEANPVVLDAGYWIIQKNTRVLVVS